MKQNRNPHNLLKPIFFNTSLTTIRMLYWPTLFIVCYFGLLYLSYLFNSLNLRIISCGLLQFNAIGTSVHH